MLRKNFFPLFIIILLFYSGIGNSQPITWYRIWGYPGIRNIEFGKCICQTFDGGYVQLVSVQHSGNAWFELLKYDYLGNFQWVKSIIDSINYSRMIVDMKQTNDSSFIFAGFFSGALLIKLDKNGILKWQRIYTDFNSTARFNSVCQTTDNGYIACGYYDDNLTSTTKAIVIKVDTIGNLIWKKQYSDSIIHTNYSSIIQGSDKNYYLAGGTFNNLSSPGYSVFKKLDTLGNILLTRIFYPYSGMGFITQLKDSAIILGGYDEIPNYPLLCKFSLIGQLEWIKNYPSTNNFFFYYMTKNLFDNIILTGSFNIGGQYSTIGLWRLDTSGNILKLKILNFVGYNSIGAFCIKSTIDTGYILTGDVTLSGNDDVLTIKMDSAFNLPLISKIYNNTFITSTEFDLFQNYPNPFNSTTKIEFNLPKSGYVIINIFDILGKKVFSKKKYFQSGLNEYNINFNEQILSSGIYFIKVNFESNSRLIKVIYLK